VLTSHQIRKYWNLIKLQAYVQTEHPVVSNSKQSYYTLLEEIGMSWEKDQKRNLKAGIELVKKKDKTLQTD
jgi:transposase